MKKLSKLFHQFPKIPLDRTVNHLVKEGYIHLHFKPQPLGYEVRYERLKKFKTEEIKEQLK